MKKPFKDTRLYKYLRPFASWRFLVSFGSAWMITNGFWYFLAFAPLGLPSWLVWVSRWYIGILYLPITPEKLVTIPLAIFIHVKMFKKDTKTKLQLEEMHQQAKLDWIAIKNKLKKKKKDSE